MWLCTPYGFFSIVKTDPSRKGGVDGFMIRARDREHLVTLKAVMEENIAPPVGISVHDLKFDIIDSPDNDYAARIIIPRAVLPAVFELFAASITYGNFKSHVHMLEHDNAGKRRPSITRYLNFLHSCWSLSRSTMQNVIPVKLAPVSKAKPAKTGFNNRHED